MLGTSGNETETGNMVRLGLSWECLGVLFELKDSQGRKRATR